VQHPLSSAIISQAYPAQRRRSALGIYNFAGDLGKMIVAFGIAVSAVAIGWEFTVLSYGAIVAVGGIGLLFVLSHYALGQRRAPAKKSAQSDRKEQSKLLDLTDPRGFGLLSSIQAIDSAGRTGALTLLPFVLLQKGASQATIGFALACIFAGGAVGKLACGLLAQQIGIIRTVIITELATAMIVGSVLLAPLSVVIVLMPLLGVALNGTSSVLYGTVTDFVHPNRQARAFGFFYTVGSTAGGSSPVLFGALSDWLGLSQALLILCFVIAITIPMAQLLRPHITNH
jgi:MFS family permease